MDRKQHCHYCESTEFYDTACSPIYVALKPCCRCGEPCCSRHSDWHHGDAYICTKCFAWEERAAIIEFDANMPRDEAERLASSQSTGEQS